MPRLRKKNHLTRRNNSGNLKMKEDQLTNALVDFEKKQVDQQSKFIIQPEKHYNHYGTRGVIDLYSRRGKDTIREKRRDHLYEVKSNVKSVDKCNEIVRQFQKMKENFYKGTELKRPSKVAFELVFTPSEKIFEHFQKNISIYQTLHNSDFNNRSFVSFRHPEKITPVVVTNSTMEFGTKEWIDYCKRTNPEVFKAISGVTQDV